MIYVVLADIIVGVVCAVIIREIAILHPLESFWDIPHCYALRDIYNNHRYDFHPYEETWL